MPREPPLKTPLKPGWKVAFLRAKRRIGASDENIYIAASIFNL
jgi:hypothetical protein